MLQSLLLLPLIGSCLLLLIPENTIEDKSKIKNIIIIKKVKSHCNDLFIIYYFFFSVIKYLLLTKKKEGDRSLEHFCKWKSQRKVRIKI